MAQTRIFVSYEDALFMIDAVRYLCEVKNVRRRQRCSVIYTSFVSNFM